MTKFAWFILCLTLLFGALGLTASSEDTQTIAFIATGVLASLLLLTLALGRRIKFDPILR
ncbi:PA3371 family protein [Pseudomonas sp. B22129]|uniref:PA3371 family protein n=1 Tax=Pseudomonas sp. B22129 TaxID=3235111 RepID=UPI003783779F